MSDIPFELKKIANEYDINIIRSDNCEKNQGAWGYEIELGEFDDKDIERMAFWHEMGHAIYSKIIKKGLESDRLNNLLLNKLTNECTAWQIGLDIAMKYGYEYGYGCKERLYALECLKTYYENKEDFEYELNKYSLSK